MVIVVFRTYTLRSIELSHRYYDGFLLLWFEIASIGT
jgi:hypothetical protein